MNITLLRNEDCRFAVLHALYLRRQGAHSAETIRTVFLANTDFTLAEVELALKDMERLHYVESAEAGMTGAETVWQITGEGLKFKEKGGLK